MRTATTPVTTLASKSTAVGMPARSSADSDVHVGHDILPIKVE